MAGNFYEICSWEWGSVSLTTLYCAQKKKTMELCEFSKRPSHKRPQIIKKKKKRCCVTFCSLGVSYIDKKFGIVEFKCSKQIPHTKHVVTALKFSYLVSYFEHLWKKNKWVKSKGQAHLIGFEKSCITKNMLSEEEQFNLIKLVDT